MKINRHGLSIGIERNDQHIFLTLKAMGTLTHQDYQTITPLIDSALEGVKAPVVNVLIDANDLQGWELEAAWDDFKVVLKHGNQFHKVAILGHKSYQKYLATIANWFLSSEVDYFESHEQALVWLKTD